MTLKTATLVLVSVVLLLTFAPVVNAQVPKGATRTPIKHIIIIMMENHSFDNILGVYPEISGKLTNFTSTLERPVNLLSLHSLSGLSAVPNGTYYTADPVEGYTVYHNDFNNGLMNGFYNNSGPQSMTYFTSSQVPIEWIWAEEYAIGEHYFSSYLSETIPNRLMSLAGFTPVNADYGPPPYIPFNETIFGELQYFNISWSYYTVTNQVSSIPLDFITGLSAYSRHVGNWSDFYSAVNSSSLPSVSWLMPVGIYDSPQSQHPPRNMTVGENWMLSAVNAVMRSGLWNSTAIFITYDEGGGYYDQVPPPVFDGVQLGFRVPFFVISPYSKENYVSGSLLNHDSMLAFIDYNWNIPPLNGFVSRSVIPLDFFDFTAPYSDGHIRRPAMPLSFNASFPQPLQYQFGNLPYKRTGSTNLTLSSMGIEPFIGRDIVRNYFSAGILLLIVGSFIIAVPVLSYLAIRAHRNRQR